MQLVTSKNKTDAIVVSTVMEAYGVVRAGLVADGTVKDVSSRGSWWCWTDSLP